MNASRSGIIRPMNVAPAYDAIDGRPDLDTVYTRCPICGVVAAVGRAAHIVEGDPTAPGWQVDQTCLSAGHRSIVTAASALARDGVKTCARPSCGKTFPVPADAEEVICPICRLRQPGPSRSQRRD
jgi:hypothetical protein